MSRKNKRIVSCVLTSLLMLCIVPAVAGRTPRFLGHKEFLPYTKNLPAVYKIELLKLQLKDERWNGEIEATKVLKGAEARMVAALWRRQAYTGSLAACHEPAYAIKFYSRRKLIAYASVCWSCNNMYFIKPNLHRTQSFLGGNKRGEQLSEIFRLAFTERE
jgi:hypothetical protein